MSHEDRKPLQLRNKVEEAQDKLFSRQPQLMERLKPFMKKAEIIEDFTEPIKNQTEPVLRSPLDPLSSRISEEPKLNGEISKKSLIKQLNKFNPNKNPRKDSQSKRIQRISQIRPDVLFGLK